MQTLLCKCNFVSIPHVRRRFIWLLENKTKSFWRPHTHTHTHTHKHTHTLRRVCECFCFVPLPKVSLPFVSSSCRCITCRLVGSCAVCFSRATALWGERHGAVAWRQPATGCRGNLGVIDVPASCCRLGDAPVFILLSFAVSAHSSTRRSKGAHPSLTARLIKY